MAPAAPAVWLRSGGGRDRSGARTRPPLVEPVETPTARVENSSETLVEKGFPGPLTVGGRWLGRALTAIANHPHRVTSAVADARTSIGSIADIPLWSMDPMETTAALQELKALAAQVAELHTRVLLHADRSDVAGHSNATSTANWHAVTTQTTRQQAHRLMRIANGLEAHHPTRTALAEGRVQVEQAEAILHALAELPSDLQSELAEKAERHLLELAVDHDAKALKMLGQRLLEVVSPETADAHQAKLLEREERAAATATRLVMWEDGHGTVHGKFTLDAVTGAALKKALLAIAAPKHQATQGPLGERRPTPERLGLAFTEYVQRYPTKRLPKAGGLNATVVVTMSLEGLLGGLKAARLDTGEKISASLARRLVCEAGIIPAVLGGKSQVLDLGRRRRFHTGAQRIVKTIEAGGCEVEGCDWPPGMTHLHHPVRWVDGGGTDRDGVMICPPHHARAHDSRYQMTRLPTGKYGFNRRT
jgi:hypothetical protein